MTPDTSVASVYPGGAAELSWVPPTWSQCPTGSLQPDLDLVEGGNTSPDITLVTQYCLLIAVIL